MIFAVPLAGPCPVQGGASGRFALDSGLYCRMSLILKASTTSWVPSGGVGHDGLHPEYVESNDRSDGVAGGLRILERASSLVKPAEAHSAFYGDGLSERALHSGPAAVIQRALNLKQLVCRYSWPGDRTMEGNPGKAAESGTRCGSRQMACPAEKGIPFRPVRFGNLLAL